MVDRVCACVCATRPAYVEATRWACPHHSCHDCGRKAAAVGGMLFRCEACPRAFCEDHLPSTSEIIGQCKRFQALGQRHPAQACFIRCDQDCVKWAQERRLEEGEDEAKEAGAQGWTMGAKVALTDAWIQERDHEIDLPLDGGGGRSKPLAHATFTDLVHFLLRAEAWTRVPFTCLVIFRATFGVAHLSIAAALTRFFGLFFYLTPPPVWKNKETSTHFLYNRNLKFEPELKQHTMQ